MLLLLSAPHADNINPAHAAEADVLTGGKTPIVKLVRLAVNGPRNGVLKPERQSMLSTAGCWVR